MKKIANLLIETWRLQKPASVVILISTLVLVLFTMTKHRLTTNPRSRIITVERILEAGTLAHATSTDTTPFPLSEDAIKSKLDGNIYSSKPPLYSFVLAATAYPVKWLTGWNFFDHQVNYIRFLVLINQVIPFLLLLILALRLGMYYTTDKSALTFLILAISAGCLAYAYTVTINNHSTAACWIFFSFFFVHSITSNGKNETWRFVAAGFLAGLAFSYELTTLAIGFVFLAVLFFKDSTRGFAALAAASAPVIITFVIYYLVTGDWKPATLQSDTFRFAGSYWNEKQGLDLLDEPKWKYAFHAIFGHHGYFSITPVLLLIPVAWIGGEWKKFGSPVSLFHLVALGAIPIVVFIIWKTSNYGGTCIGMRWWISFSPLLMFSALPVIESLCKSIAGRILMILMICASFPALYSAFRYEAFVPSWLETWWGIG